MNIVKSPKAPTPVAPVAVAPAVVSTTPAPTPVEVKPLPGTQVAVDLAKEKREAEVTTLPKTLPTAPRMFTRQAGLMTEIVQPQPVRPSFAGPQPQQPQFDDGIYMKDPNTGQMMKTELDQVDMEYLGGDPLRALYQGLVWAAESFKSLARTTPALAALSPGTESIIDQVATIGYQVTNAGAELTRGLWNWPFTRVVVNQSMEQFIHPEETATFNRLYADWYKEIIAPVEAGQAEYKAEVVKDWVLGHDKEIADPKGFVQLCSQRYAMEKVAAKSAWSPTDILSTDRSQIRGVRQKTTTGLESVFRKKPG